MRDDCSCGMALDAGAAMNEIEREEELVKRNTLSAVFHYLNFTRAAMRLGISARTVKNRVISYGYSVESIKQMRRARSRQRSMKFRKNVPLT